MVERQERLHRPRHRSERRARAAAERHDRGSGNHPSSRRRRRRRARRAAIACACCASSVTPRRAGSGNCRPARSTIASRRSDTARASSKRKPAWRAGHVAPVSATTLSSPGVFTEVVHLFLATRSDAAPPQRPEEHEVFEVHWLPFRRRPADGALRRAARRQVAGGRLPGRSARLRRCLATTRSRLSICADSRPAPFGHQFTLSRLAARSCDALQ